MLRQDTTLRLAWLLALALMFGTMAGCVGSGGSSTADTMDTNGDQSESDGEDDTSEDTEEDTTTDQTDPDMEDDVEVTEDADAEEDVPDTLMCEEGTDNCDEDDANGCEADLNAVTTCGACDNDCTGTFENASAACDAGACALGECVENFGNCDEDATNGCEEDWGFAGGECCEPGYTMELEVAGLGTILREDEGYWVIYKDGMAQTGNIYCADEWTVDQAGALLDFSNAPFEMEWTRNCPDGFNDSLIDWFNAGDKRSMTMIVSQNGSEVVRHNIAYVSITRYQNIPSGSECTETERITFSADIM